MRSSSKAATRTRCQLSELGAKDDLAALHEMNLVAFDIAHHIGRGIASA
jgi:hypothetical protein